MNEIKEYRGFIVGEKVVCILNNRASLTVGREYTIESLEVYENDPDIDSDFWICVVNDSRSYINYHYTRFINKNDFRTHLIDEIIK